MSSKYSIFNDVNKVTKRMLYSYLMKDADDHYLIILCQRFFSITLKTNVDDYGKMMNVCLI